MSFNATREKKIRENFQIYSIENFKFDGNVSRT